MSFDEYLDEADFEQAPETWRTSRSVPVHVSAEYYLRQRVKNPLEAARLAREGALKGSVESQCAWGHMLLTGHGTERDPEAAFRWFQIAAREGDAAALNMLGRCYERGWGVTLDFVEAARCYQRAADKSDHWAQFNLACLLVSGAGVARDYSAALTLLLNSARAGNAKAMNMLGRFREEGWGGVEAKPHSAMQWYYRAANRGCFRGQFHFSRYLCREGRIGEAVLWLTKSLAAAPDDFVREAVEMLRNSTITEIRQAALTFEKGRT
ncbi:tetratricopeptide repeat protein [Hyphomicrobium sp.]|uniref:tetratricopeptide repeat protein n=1 Tax=Hyphomicrobium sp. TaxID=82 RepID=UPI002D79FE10|nr:tetratricopeptide repeat protein [Hyphomicrobium sp.]HET6388558.1 tetratricopeptide repeat protein [Hyphomicrobium sp.]